MEIRWPNTAWGFHIDAFEEGLRRVYTPDAA
jgi:hypothetical protein